MYMNIQFHIEIMTRPKNLRRHHSTFRRNSLGHFVDYLWRDIPPTSFLWGVIPSLFFLVFFFFLLLLESLI